MKNYDPYDDPAFDPASFTEEDFLRAVYDDSPVYLVSVLNPFRYRQAVRFTEKLRAAVDAQLRECGETADYTLEFDRFTGTYLCFSVRLPAAGVFLAQESLTELLRDAPPFDLSITPLPWKQTCVCLVFRDVKKVIEQQ